MLQTMLALGPNLHQDLVAAWDDVIPRLVGKLEGKMGLAILTLCAMYITIKPMMLNAVVGLMSVYMDIWRRHSHIMV